MTPSFVRPAPLVPSGPKGRGWELVAWSMALAVLMEGEINAALTLIPSLVAAGEWWRLATHPFVHVSWYHLLLDGAAFLLLWQALEGRLSSRLGTLIASALGSVLFAAAGSREFWSIGLCGLSGVAHGLMLKQGMDLWSGARSPGDRRLGMALTGGVLAKCFVEALTGAAFFSSWHFGPLGTPIVICHLGGACGAALFHIGMGQLRAPATAPAEFFSGP